MMSYPAKTAKAGIVVGFVLALALTVILQAVRSRTVNHTTTLAITEYEDGRVEVTRAVPSAPRDAVAGRGIVRVRFDEERRGWPIAGTIRYSPAAIQIVPIVGSGSLSGPVTRAQWLAITEAVRQTGNNDTLKALERRTWTVEQRWWGWAVSLLACWVVAGGGVQGIHGLITHIRETRGKLRQWEGQCPSCGYDLSGCPQVSRCPECGAVLPERARYWAGRKGHDRRRP